MKKQLAALLQKPVHSSATLHRVTNTAVNNYVDGVIVDLDMVEVIYRCPLCWRQLSLHIGLRVVYWQCSRWPKCKATVPDVDGQPKGIKPKIVLRKKV